MFQSIISKLLLQKEEGKGSYSLTMTVIAFIVINLKLIFAGVEFGHILKFSEFSGVDYAAALAACSALHLGNKAVNSSINTKEDNKDVN